MFHLKRHKKQVDEKPMILSTPKLVICKNFTPPPKKKKKMGDIHGKKTLLFKASTVPNIPNVGRTVVDPPRGIVGEIRIAQEFPPEGHRKTTPVVTRFQESQHGQMVLLMEEIPFPTTWDGAKTL